jgi:hypothetical protein
LNTGTTATSDLAKEKGKRLERIYGSCYLGNALICQAGLAQKCKSTITPYSDTFQCTVYINGRCDVITFLRYNVDV